ncbi:MAG: aldo/keto reductase [Ignavibacteriaceae bacterium]|nr:aldo/keto reductase [Ignavibacteriaceae bacterium]
MKYRQLGNSDLNISEVSLGCWTMGGLNWVNGVPNGWANVDENEIQAAVDYALDHGVNHFDNADVYGNGRAERMLARVLGKKNKDVIIATKVGWFPGTAEHAYEPLHIRRQCEQSLINLKRDYIDLYYFHHGNFGDNWEYLDDAVEVMFRLKEEGKIRHIGQSAYSHDHFTKLIQVVKPAACQSSANYTDDKFVADGTPTTDAMKANNCSFIAFFPILQGILLGKYSKDNPPKFEAGDHRANAPRFKKEFLEELEPKLEKIKTKFGSGPLELGRAAIGYLLYHNVVGAVITGFRNQEQVKMNIQMAENPITEDEYKFIKSLF